jgi:hypothetical protein
MILPTDLSAQAAAPRRLRFVPVNWDSVQSSFDRRAGSSVVRCTHGASMSHLPRRDMCTPVRSGRTASPATSMVVLLAFAVFLAGCGIARPDRLIEPDVVGLVTSTDRPRPDDPLTVELNDRSIEIDTRSVLALGASGIGPGVLLLYGEDDGRIWYATAILRETSPVPGCYALSGDAAFDAPDAVVLVSLDWRDVGLRLPKRDGFAAPPGDISSDDGRYLTGERGELAVFCVDPHGAVFGMT